MDGEGYHQGGEEYERELDINVGKSNTSSGMVLGMNTGEPHSR